MLTVDPCKEFGNQPLLLIGEVTTCKYRIIILNMSHNQDQENAYFPVVFGCNKNPHYWINLNLTWVSPPTGSQHQLKFLIMPSGFEIIHCVRKRKVLIHCFYSSSIMRKSRFVCSCFHRSSLVLVRMDGQTDGWLDALLMFSLSGVS